VGEWAVYICRPPSSPTCVRYIKCPTCERVRRMTQWYMGAWYGDVLTCLSCGDAWSGGEMAERPFKPRWRAESVAHAKRRLDDWRMSRDDYRAWVWRQLKDELGEEAAS
jgi:hypothetical protein